MRKKNCDQVATNMPRPKWREERKLNENERKDEKKLTATNK